jgi:hypothetical protein
MTHPPLCGPRVRSKTVKHINVIREWAGLLGFVAILILGVAWVGLLSLDLRDRRHGGGSRGRSLARLGGDRHRDSFGSGRASLGSSGIARMGPVGANRLGARPHGSSSLSGSSASSLRMVPRPRKGLAFVPASISEAAERRQIVLVSLSGTAVVTLAGTFLVSRTLFVLHAVTDGALAAFGVLWTQRERHAAAAEARRTVPLDLGEIEFEPLAQEA